MTIEILTLLSILLVMAFFFFTEKLPIELTAFCGLVTMVLLGYVPANNAFDGFASPAVITMFSIFFLSAALFHTGVADSVAKSFERRFGSNQIALVIAIMLAGGLLSGIMNNIAAVAVMLPAVASIARHTGCSPGQLFMPLSFGAILGGTATSVGSPPNIIVTEILRERGLEPFSFFDFTPIGLCLLLVGTIYMVFVGVRLLPSQDKAKASAPQIDLFDTYKVRDRIFSIEIPEGSQLVGKRLRDSGLGSTLEVQVVGIHQEGQRRLAPEPETILSVGDILILKGSAQNIQRLLRIGSTEFVEAHPGQLDAFERISGFAGQLRAGSSLAGRSLRELGFRERFGGVVIAIKRNGEVSQIAIGNELLQEQDELIIIGTRAKLEMSELEDHFELTVMDAGSFEDLAGYLYFLSVPENSPLIDRTLAETRIGELVGLTVLAVVRDDETRMGTNTEEKIRHGDKLLVTGQPDRIRSILEIGHVELQQDVSHEALESERVGVAEVTIAPRSRNVGQTLAEIKFRDSFGLQVLAVWREDNLIQSGLANLSLRFGDALLVQGPWEKIRLLSANPEFFVLSSLAQEPRRTNKAPIALFGVLMMIAVVISGYQPIHVASFMAATFVVLFGAITMEEAYQTVEWRALFLVAAILPVGVAMETTGTASLMSHSVVELAGPSGPYAVLATLVVLSSLLSQSLDGAPAVVLLAPVAFAASSELGIDPRPLILGVAIAASAAFATPFSHKANLLVMGAGGYRVSDYVKVGTPLTILQLILIVALVPMFFDF